MRWPWSRKDEFKPGDKALLIRPPYGTYHPAAEPYFGKIVVVLSELKRQPDLYKKVGYDIITRDGLRLVVAPPYLQKIDPPKREPTVLWAEVPWAKRITAPKKSPVEAPAA